MEGLCMKNEVRRFLEQAKKSGVCEQECTSDMSKDEVSNVYDFIQRELAIGVQKGLSVELIYENLLKVVSEKQLCVYIQVQQFITAKMSKDGVSDIYDSISEKIEMCKQERLSLELMCESLLKVVSVEQMYDYLETLRFINIKASRAGLLDAYNSSRLS